MLKTNSIRELAIAAAAALAVFAVVATVVIAIRRRFRAAEQTGNERHAILLDLARRTNLLLIALIAIYAGSHMLVLDRTVTVIVAIAARLAMILQAGLWAAGIVDVLIAAYRRRRLESDPSAITMIRAFRFGVLVAVWSVALLAALENVGINVTAFVTGLGIGGVAIALAVQNVLADLFASLSIVLDKPFVVGDFITVSDDAGSVERIGLKTTRIRSLSGEQLVFSNNELLKNRIHNYKRMDERRILFRIGVVYQATPEQLEQIPAIIRRIIESTANVRFDRAHFAAFGDSSYDFEIVYYVTSADYNVYMDAQQAINLAMVRAFAAEKIEFAYPTRTLLIENQAGASR